MIEHAIAHLFGRLPPKVKATIALIVAPPLLAVALITAPVGIARAVYGYNTVVSFLICVTVPCFILSVAFTGVSLATLALRRPYGFLGAILMLAGIAATVAFLAFSLNELNPESAAIPQKGIPLARILQIVCGPGIMFAGLVFAVIHVKQGARPAHLHNHELPPA